MEIDSPQGCGKVRGYLVVQQTDPNAASPFYGGQPPEEDVARIKAPLLIQYAENDEPINAGWPKYEAALKQAWQRTVAFFNQHLRG